MGWGAGVCRLLGWPPAEWLRVMSREQTLHAALKLQRDESLMLSNLNVMHQYAISLHRTALDILVFGRHLFPSAAVNDAEPVPCVLRATTHMASMGLWRPPNDPGGPRLEVIHQDPQCSGCPACLPRPSGFVTGSFPAGHENCRLLFIVVLVHCERTYIAAYERKPAFQP